MRFVGITMNMIANSIIINIAGYDWRIIICLIVAGLGGVLYGDAE